MRSLLFCVLILRLFTSALMLNPIKSGQKQEDLSLKNVIGKTSHLIIPCKRFYRFLHAKPLSMPDV